MDITPLWMRRLGVVGLAVTIASACESGLGATASETSAPGAATAATFLPNQLGVTEATQLPDPCTLLSAQTVRGRLGPTAPGAAVDGAEYDGVALLFRTCQWGNTDGPNGAIGVQVGVANSVGRDVVYNRSTAMDPALDVSIGEDGRETMYMGELPTGGAKGSTIFFRINGYSVLVGHVGPGSSLDSVETLGTEVLAALGG